MTNLVARLRDWSGQESICTCVPLALEAADEIERLSIGTGDAEVTKEQLGFIKDVLERLDDMEMYAAPGPDLSGDLDAAIALLNAALNASEPKVCPYCGSLEQHTDPRGTCANPKCGLPWDRKDWMPGVDDAKLNALKS